MTVVSRATSRRTRPGNNRRTRTTPRAGRGPTRGRTRSTRRYLVPALLSRTSDQAVSRKRTDVRAAIVLWFLMAADLATVIWMYTLGEWLDHASKFTATTACILSLTALTGLVALLLAALVTRLLVGPLRP
jgi:hypothetical protein